MGTYSRSPQRDVASLIVGSFRVIESTIPTLLAKDVIRLLEDEPPTLDLSTEPVLPTAEPLIRLSPEDIELLKQQHEKDATTAFPFNGGIPYGTAIRAIG